MSIPLNICSFHFVCSPLAAPPPIHTALDNIIFYFFFIHSIHLYFNNFVLVTTIFRDIAMNFPTRSVDNQTKKLNVRAHFGSIVHFVYTRYGRHCTWNHIMNLSRSTVEPNSSLYKCKFHQNYHQITIKQVNEQWMKMSMNRKTK